MILAVSADSVCVSVVFHLVTGSVEALVSVSHQFTSDGFAVDSVWVNDQESVIHFTTLPLTDKTTKRIKYTGVSVNSLYANKNNNSNKQQALIMAWRPSDWNDLTDLRLNRVKCVSALDSDNTDPTERR